MSLCRFLFLILQNFDLEKKEENSEADEDGLKAESPDLVWQIWLFYNSSRHLMDYFSSSGVDAASRPWF